ncbi:cytochrome P450 [Nocardia sp. alder85J]|uniref:cytochrome P450 n=1 Tax=Nocardia sp. alder85J TaxID=2862949 RepID=UPI001CD28667|nr:cytochrome P450 [Nocardia sp. alder85J]MCX4097741.1 hypothetical protein [Nocardia sp. alder85J]
MTLPPAVPTSTDPPPDIRCPLAGAHFAADPATAYTSLRDGGLGAAVTAAGLPVTVVTGRAAVMAVLDNEGRFPADPMDTQPWVHRYPLPAPARRWRADVRHTSGAHHERLRRAIHDALTGVDQFALAAAAETRAAELISGFPADGADLVLRYAFPLVIDIFAPMIGLPGAGEPGSEARARLENELWMLRGAESTEPAHQGLVDIALEVVAERRGAPRRPDVLSRLLDHPAVLTDIEVAHQVAMLYSTGAAAVVDLIAGTLLQILGYDRADLGERVFSGSLLPQDAAEYTLRTHPPVAIAGPRWPTGEHFLHTTAGADLIRVPAWYPVLASLAAANTDPGPPAITVTGDEDPSAAVPALPRDEDPLDRRDHLGWGAGVHACPVPARDLAMILAAAAVTQLQDLGPSDIALAVRPSQVLWVADPARCTLASLPVTFPPRSAPRAC